MPLNFYLYTFLLNIFSVFVALYLHNLRQILASSIITKEKLGKSYSATSTFKCWESTAAVLVLTEPQFS